MDKFAHFPPTDAELLEHYSKRIQALRAEIERIKQERDDAIDAEKIVLREIGAENERLHAKRLAEHEQYDQWRQERDALRAENERLRAALEKWRPIIERASDWYVRQGDVPRAKAFTAMLSDFDAALVSDKRA